MGLSPAVCEEFEIVQQDRILRFMDKIKNLPSTLKEVELLLSKIEQLHYELDYERNVAKVRPNVRPA